jgi:acetyl esterase/lipase
MAIHPNHVAKQPQNADFARRAHRPAVRRAFPEPRPMLMRLVAATLFAALPSYAVAQTTGYDATAWSAEIASRYFVVPNIAYGGANHSEASLDIFVPRDASAAARVATVIFFHGGGWTGGDKAVGVLRLLPFLEMGWAAVNVNYRLGQAPAAVEDARCALRWVIRNADRYNLDVTKVVVTGESAGSHLALAAGLLPASAGLDGCSGPEPLAVAAIINWYGVTDVVDVIADTNQKEYAVRWLGGQPDRESIARRVSPIQYVNAASPAVITIHGDADRVAPYNHAVRLHQALDQAGVPNRLLTWPGRDHGAFARDEIIRSYGAIREFLRDRGVLK